MNERYRSMLDLPRPVSENHRPMSRLDRAMQFAPFAALTGFDGQIAEAARWTDSRALPDEGALEELDRVFADLRGQLEEQPEVTVTRFRPDGLKAGGVYEETSGRVKSLDPLARLLLFTDGRSVPLDDITALRRAGGNETEDTEN